MQRCTEEIYLCWFQNMTIMQTVEATQTSIKEVQEVYALLDRAWDKGYRDACRSVSESGL